MKKIETTFKVTSKLFLGSADNASKDLTIRPPSIKGALRFWWRATVFPSLVKSHDNQKEALKALHKKEMRLFGSAVKDTSGGQSLVLLKVNNVFHQGSVRDPKTFEYKTSSNIVDSDDGSVIKEGIKYLAGLGLVETVNRKALYTRSWIKPNTHFDLTLVLKNDVTDAEIEELCTALKAFGLLGGMGSRSRKGFGSVQLAQMTCGDKKWDEPTSVEDYQSEVKSLCQSGKGLSALPDISAFSEYTAVQISREDTAEETLLNSLGRSQLYYRSFGFKKRDGNNHFVSGNDLALQIFADDHINVARAGSGDIKEVPEYKRVVFGLPQGADFTNRSGKQEAKINVHHDGKKDGRRASPLFTHVQVISGKCYAIHCLLGARWLPEDAKMKLDLKRSTIGIAKQTPDWQVILDFLELPQYVGQKGEPYQGFGDRVGIFKGTQLQGGAR